MELIETPQRPSEQLSIEERLSIIEAELLRVKPLLDRQFALLETAEGLMRDIAAEIESKGVLGMLLAMKRGK